MVVALEREDLRDGYPFPFPADSEIACVDSARSESERISYVCLVRYRRLRTVVFVLPEKQQTAGARMNLLAWSVIKQAARVFPERVAR